MTTTKNGVVALNVTKHHYMTDISNILYQYFESNGFSEYLAQKEMFSSLYNSLVETNRQYNLTAVTSPEGVSSLHFADSLTACEYIPKNASVLDIGCGAGFPSLPIAIVRPDLTVTGIDSTSKKIDFSTNFAKENGITNFSSFSARAEELAHTKLRESYDFVTARAVARLNILAELALPLVKIGGSFLAMKGTIGAEEWSEAKDAVEFLGGELVKIHKKALNTDRGEQKRSLILIKKVKKTPFAYPRQYSKIAKKPL